MSVPTHHSNCHTYAYPTRCYLCGEEVYFFFVVVDRVFFDELNYPWKIHNCFLYQMKDIIEDFISQHSGTRTIEYIRRLILNSAEDRDIPVPIDRIELLENYIRRVTSTTTIVNVKPDNDYFVGTGEITNINKNINFYKNIN